MPGMITTRHIAQFILLFLMVASEGFGKIPIIEGFLKSYKAEKLASGLGTKLFQFTAFASPSCFPINVIEL